VNRISFVRFVRGGAIVRKLLGRAKRRVIADLRTDPYLPYILLLAMVLAGFWFWHRIPQFATVDEGWRFRDPLIAVRAVARDPGFVSLQQGITADRLAGATFYLYGLVVIPVFLVAYIGRQTGLYQFGGLWVRTWSLLLSRLAIVVLAVGCIYLTYRIGTAMRDRTTGRLAAVLLSVTFGFLVMAHEVGEDLPAMFFLLLTLVLALRYMKTGDETAFFAGCAAGGFAIAFKLTAGTSVFVLGIAYFLRAYTSNTTLRSAVVRPRLIGGGIVLGAVAVVLGFPEILVGGPDVFIDHLTRVSTGRASLNGPTAPSWWWLLRGYLNGLGLPLFVGAIIGVVAGIARLREQAMEANATILLLAVFAVYLLVYSGWTYVRLHHLLPTFPLLILLVAIALSGLYERDRSLARPILALLLVTSGAYAGMGVLSYANAPRDEATEWLNTNAPDSAVMETYRGRPRDAALPRGMRISMYRGQSQNAAALPRGRRISSYADVSSKANSSKKRPTKTEWMLNMTNRCPQYIQLTYWDFVMLGTTSPGATRPPLQADYRGPTPTWMPATAPVPRQANHTRGLLGGEYNYTIAAEFGPRPSMWPQPRTQTSLLDLLYTGVYPWTITYGDDPCVLV
jgi:type III secretory pathway component EscS